MSTITAQYEAFTDLARNYCAAIEDSSIRGKDGLRYIHDLLLPLHLAAMQLPDVKSLGELVDTIEHEDWDNVYKELRERIPCKVYWETFDPLKDPPNPAIACSPADDLSDIWRDLKEGLFELDAKGSKAQLAVWWEWRFGFHTHWGAHSASALRVMYYALRDS